MLLIGPLGTNFNEMLIEILTFSFQKMYLKVLSAKWRPFCLGLSVLNDFHHESIIARKPSWWEWFQLIGPREI